MAAIASIGGLFLVAGLALVAALVQFRSTIYLVFLFMSGVAPSLSAYLIYLSERSSAVRPQTFCIILVVIKSFLLCCLATLIFDLLIKAAIGPQPVPTWILTIVFLVAAALIFPRFGRQAAPWSELAGRLDVYLIVVLAVVIFVLSPFDPNASMPVGLASYALNARDFGFWALLGIAWTAAGIWLRRHEGWAFPHRKKLLESLALSVVGVVILALYDDGHFVDFGHYAPLVGPAMHAKHGGIAMVDVYSVYGLLPWLIYQAAFAVFTPTFGTAAVVLRLVNLCYFAVILSILFFVSRRRVSALWFFVPALLVAMTSHGSGAAGMLNLHGLPMTLGGRWLLPAVMTLMLVVATRSKWARWAALVPIMLASLSSIDILAFTLGPWGVCLLLDSLRSRSGGLFLRWSVLACAAIAVAQAALVAVIYLSAGEVIDYRPYLDLFFRFRPAEESHWSVPFDPYYALWLPIGLAYFLVMAAATYRALRGEAPDSLIERLLPVAVLGLGPLAYFFGRPQEATLNIACLSFAVVAIGIAEAAFVNTRRFGPAGSALAVTMAVAFAFIIADGFEHFMRPADPARGNYTVLRRCLSAEGCSLGGVARNIGLALHTQPLDPLTKVGYGYYLGDPGPRQRIEEAISMLRRLAPGERYIGMLTDLFPTRYGNSDDAVSLTSFMATGQWFAWSISNTVIDDFSPLIAGPILKRVAATPAGTLIIVPNQRAGWAPLNQRILDRLGARCRLVLVEEGKYHSAFRTEACAA